MSLLTSLASLFKPAPRATPTDHTARIRSGDALLVDVREPAEWRGGIAESAALLPLSDLRGARQHWRDFLSAVRDRDVILYCASGMRSGVAARLLAGEGVRALNGGGLHDWAASGWPIVLPSSTRQSRNQGKS